MLAAALLATTAVSYLLASRRATPAALAGLQSDELVAVSQGDWIAFAPRAAAPDTGLVLYPGGFVDARAYSRSARRIAAAGFLVLLVRPALGVSFLAIDAARPALAAHPEIEHWAVGGHSLGGTAAARFALRHPDAVEGLVLWAAYPAAGDDLSVRNLDVLSLYGERDGLVAAAQIRSRAHLLPPDTSYVAIPGGNHAQFGRYGDGTQSGDNPATITVDQQERLIADAVARFLDALDGTDS